MYNTLIKELSLFNMVGMHLLLTHDQANARGYRIYCPYHDSPSQWTVNAHAVDKLIQHGYLHSDLGEISPTRKGRRVLRALRPELYA